MKRLHLTVEGQTEAEFARAVLIPHLSNFGVFLTGIRFTGPHGRRGGRIPRGGLLNTFGHTLRDMQRWMSEDQSPDARFSMMIDLYGLPSDFPDHDTGLSMATGRDQATSMEQSLAKVMNDLRFIPYLQVHEFEALVLADPGRLELLYEVKAADLAAIKKECQDFDSPEDMNHGQHSHPKYRIQRRVPEYDENIAGPLLIGDIGLSTLRERCPHFGAWLTRLEGLDAGGV